MRKPASVGSLVDFGRTRLSKSFFMRDFLFSDIASMYGLANVPDDPDLAIAAGQRLCQDVLEPLQAVFGRIAIRSAYRSSEVNRLGNEKKLNCASNEKNFASHIWDRRDANGHMGATACIVVPAFWDRFQAQGDWQKLAWWIHDHLPYHYLEFFPTYWAFNIAWHEAPERSIYAHTAPKGYLTRPGMPNHAGDHSALWSDIFPIQVMGG